MAFADLNRDGRPDLITNDFKTDQVSVLLGKARLSFAPAKVYATGANPWGLAVGDLNRDGKPDVVTANCWGGNVSVLLGDGKGTLGAKTDKDVTGGSNTDCPQGVAVADLNRDGKPDVAVAIETGHAIKILLGSGDGKLGDATAIADVPATAMPVFVALADIDRNGTPDLLAADIANDAVLVLRGNGDGTFALDTSYPVGADPRQVAVGDINKDGIQDILTANEGSANVSVLIGQADGSFAGAVPYSPGFAVRSIALADTNADGHLDIITGNGLNRKVSVMPGHGDGTFDTATAFAAGRFTNGVATADLNRDGLPEIAAANQNGNSLSVLKNVLSPKPTGGSWLKSEDKGTGTGPAFVATGDINRDGSVDLIVANQGSNNLSVLRGNQAGTFGVARSVTLPAGISAPTHVALGDLNRDGKPDLAVAGTGGIAVLIRKPNGSFARRAFLGRSAAAVAIGDVDGNGVPDLIAANPAEDKVTVIRRRANGRVLQARAYDVGDEPVSLKLADLNRDGRLDIAVANKSGNSVSLLLRRPLKPIFALAAVSPSVGSSPRALEVADFDTDGKLDIAVINHDSSNLSILLRSPSGSFEAAVNYPAGGKGTSLTLADINRDGVLDAAIASDAGGALPRQRVKVLYGKRDGTFRAPAPIGPLTGTNLSSVASGDFNGDGRPDLAVTNVPGNLVRTFINQPATGTP